MSGDKPAGAVAGLPVVLAVCCGRHALLLGGQSWLVQSKS